MNLVVACLKGPSQATSTVCSSFFSLLLPLCRLVISESTAVQFPLHRGQGFKAY
jgi:hypothetical protein